MTDPSPALAASGHSDASARARTPITLGAAFAILCVAIFGLDEPISYAAGGFLEVLFGGGSGYAGPSPFYGGGSGASRYGYGYSRRHSRHARRYHARYAYAHRHMSERRRGAVADRRNSSEERRLAAQFDRSERRPGGIERVSFAEMSAAAPPATPQTLARRTVCVRACDGYFFPIGNLKSGSEVSSQQATCQKLCPGAEAKLFVMPAGSDKIEEAVAARGGDSYSAFVARLNGSDAKSQSCGCQISAGGAAPHAAMAFQSDNTLRPGDSIVTPQGVRVLRRGSQYPFTERDFVSLAETHDVPASNKRALVAIERVLNTPQGRLLASAERRHVHRHAPAAAFH